MLMYLAYKTLVFKCEFCSESNEKQSVYFHKIRYFINTACLFCRSRLMALQIQFKLTVILPFLLRTAKRGDINQSWYFQDEIHSKHYIFSTQYFCELRNMATKLGRSLGPGPSLTRKLYHHVTRMCQISGGEGPVTEA